MVGVSTNNKLYHVTKDI